MATSSPIPAALVGAGEPLTGPAVFDARFTHGFVGTAGQGLHYVRGGHGRPLVLLHGFPATWYDWHSIMPALAATHDVVAFGLPGLGDSDPLADGFSHQSVARQLLAACRALDLDGADLLAHDMGAWLAYPLLREDPTYFRRVVVLDVGIPGFGLEDRLGEVPLWHFGLHRGAPDLAAQLVAGREALYLGHFYDDFAPRPDTISPTERAEFLRTYTRADTMHTAFHYYADITAAGEANRALAGDKLPQAVLALGGEYGGGAPVSSWQQVATQVTGETAPHTGHYMVQEQPAWLLARVLPFLAG